MNSIRSFSLNLSRALALVVWPVLAGADSSGITDVRTPAEIGAGISSSSYALTNIDSVDPYSGSLNVHIPLLTLGGRGDTQYAVSFGIQHFWIARGSQDQSGNGYLFPVATSTAETTLYVNVPTVFGTATLASPGYVRARTAINMDPGSLSCTGAG